MAAIVREEDRHRTVARELASRLPEFNERMVGPLNSKRIVLSVRADGGALIAGLTGELFWNAAFSDVLWVDEPNRGRGYGSALLRHVESIAARE
jgi:ribosomal protein S18 acetylase RimI-like enzyme